MKLMSICYCDTQEGTRLHCGSVEQVRGRARRVFGSKRRSNANEGFRKLHYEKMHIIDRIYNTV